MRRISMGDRIGWCAVALIALLLAPDHPYAAFALVVSIVAIRIGVKFDQRRSERRRLAVDATVQHQALLAGSDQVGVYGRYPPPMAPGGEVIIPSTPWPPEQREENMRVALEKVCAQHAEALDKLADL
jgi:hypothetical protein